MKKENKKLWFKAKNYGWGWVPCSWEGWLCILVWVMLFSFGVVRMENEWMKNLFFIFIMTAILLLICWKKGERPSWRWGRTKRPSRKTNIIASGIL